MRYVALLRGINVGGHNKIRMADLREAIEAAEFDNVSTYLQSGNLFFDAKTKPTESALSEIIKENFGLDIPIVIQTKSQVLSALKNNPFSDRDFDPKRLHVMYMSKSVSESKASKFDTSHLKPDEMKVIGNHTYVLYKQDSWSSKATIYVPEKQFGVTATARNWNTANKLSTLVDQ